MKNSRQGLTIVCQQCYYPDNRYDSPNCEVCGASLASALEANQSLKLPKSSARKRKLRLSQKYLVFAIAIAIVSGGFYFYKTQLLVAKSDREQFYSDTIFPQTALMKEVAGVPQGYFDYAGATTFAAVNDRLNTSIKKDYPEFELHYQEPSKGTPGGSAGIKMLLDGDIAFAQSGRPFKQKEYDTAKSRGFAIKQVPVAIDGIVIFVNPALKIEKLSLDRVRNIFSGKITNWKQVGGPDLAITPISTNPKTHVILPLVMGVEKPTVGKNVKIVRDYTHAIRQTAATPGAISFASAAIMRSQQSIKPLALAKEGSKNFVFPFVSKGQVDINAFRSSKYPLTRRMFVAYRLDGTPEEQAGIAYANLLMSTQGQQIFKEAGFANLYGK
jgi:phosphate transport system substrate-binding protein